MSRGGSLGGEGQSSYFNSVTGTNDYERQSWRDSYNGGRAAGDLTGNTNARLDAERSAFQGTTWSGSSTQPSALEFAQSLGGVGYPAVSNGPQSSVSSGPGNAVVVSVPVVSVPRKTSGGSLTFGVPGKAPLTTKIKDEATGGYAGLQVTPNPWFSDVENWWEPRYGEPGEWLGGIVNIGADAVFNVRSWADAVRGPAPEVAGPRGFDPIWGNPGGQQALDFVGGVGAGFVVTAPTSERDLPNPMVWRPASAW